MPDNSCESNLPAERLDSVEVSSLQTLCCLALAAMCTTAAALKALDLPAHLSAIVLARCDNAMCLQFTADYGRFVQARIWRPHYERQLACSSLVPPFSSVGVTFLPARLTSYFGEKTLGNPEEIIQPQHFLNQPSPPCGHSCSSAAHFFAPTAY